MRIVLVGEGSCGPMSRAMGSKQRAIQIGLANSPKLATSETAAMPIIHFRHGGAARPPRPTRARASVAAPM